MKELLSGNEAIARGAWEAGLHFAAAYPGTPSTEIMENLSRYKEVFCEWSTNEKVALEVALGATFAGARAIVSQKHVGLNVAADPFFSASYIGVTGGFVIVTADDPGMHSSQNEQDNRHYARAARMPLMEPSDSQEAKEFTRMAYDISEKFDTPILMRMTTRTSHSKSLVELGERKEVPIVPYQKDTLKRLLLPGHARKRHVFVEKRMADLAEFSNTFPGNFIHWGDREIGYIASGISYQYAREAFPEASFLKISFSYPLPEKLIREFAAGVKKIVVIEENDPIMETEIKAMLCGQAEVHGKDLIPRQGELNPNILRESMGLSSKSVAPQTSLPPRPPALCAGCPPTSVFYTLHQLKAIVTGDIGCYTLGAMAPLSSIDTTVDMGASISNAHGMDITFRLLGGERKKVVGVIGDSTFFHSGITSLIDMVYNRGMSTVVILDNRITAMTGHQQNPGTGLTIKGDPTVQVDIEALVKACGVKDVHVVDPYDLKNLKKVISEAMDREEPSVVITKRPCVLLFKKSKWTSCKVDRDLCIGCKICVQLGCPAISFKEKKSSIDPMLCTACGLCADLCPKKAISLSQEGGRAIREAWDFETKSMKKEEA